MKTLSRLACLSIVGYATDARAAAILEYRIRMDTAALQTHSASPFAIRFQLIEGDGTGFGNNVATVDSFDFGTGSSSGTPLFVGDATGDLVTGVVLTDSQSLNLFTQSFMPGSSLSFSIRVTRQANPGGVPDRFAFSIVDGSGLELPTSGFIEIGADILLYIDLPGDFRSFGSDPTLAPFGGGDALDLEPPRVEVDSLGAEVPEPGCGWLAAGLLAISLLRLRR